jgi:hypothetical protein
MADRRRSIPRVATASLVLGGMSSCGRQDATLAKAARAQCRALFECDRLYFESYYSSLDDCQAEVEDYYEPMVATLSDVCADALFEYVVCASNVFARTCDSDRPEIECAQERARFDDVCY